MAEPYRPPRMKFGIFMAPFHRVGESPTVAFERDLALVEHLDRLDYDEAWFGEHHSAGWELFASPELMIATAAQRTRTIKLGTGVVSLPYHHPLMVADRMVQLDHLTRGRAMLGVGPGALSSDAYMMGIDPVTQRPRMDEALGAIMRLFRGEVVDMETDWFTLRDARLQIAPYTPPHMPVAVASTFSPSGPTAAGKHGVGILSVATAQPDSLISLPKVWGMVEDSAEKHSQQVHRRDWRLVMFMHLAESRQQAIDEVAEECHAYWRDYFSETLGTPIADARTIEEMIDTGTAIVGTPDDAVELIERLVDISGGFGTLLFQAVEWATWEQTLRSYELFARKVAPRFQGQYAQTRGSQQWVSENRTTIFAPSGAAIGKAFQDAGVEIPQEMVERMQRGRT